MTFRDKARAIRLAAISSLTLLPLSFAPAAHADSVNGTGQAPITKDVETVRNAALKEARRDLVRTMLTKTIGRDRLAEIPPASIDEIAGQIRPDMITGQTAAREGALFNVTLTADIDQAWFRGILSDYGIDSASQRADGDRQLILVYLDRDDGTATDLSKPAEVNIAYDRQTGASYSDHSIEAAASKEASASSSRSASGSSVSASGAARYSGYGERGAAGYSGRSSSASVSKSSQAYAASSSYINRTAVDAEVHDNVSYREHVVYQQPPRSVDGDAIKAGLSGAMLDYGVSVADSWMAMSAYFPQGVPRYADLKQDARFGGFLQSLKARNTPFFMGGTFKVTQSGNDPASNQALCSGELNATASASDDGRIIGSGQFPATALGISPEDCAANLTRKMATTAAQKLGPDIQKYWRNKARAAVGQDSRQLADYTLVLRAPRLDMAMQQDLLDALQDTPGVESQSFVSQGSNEIRFTVRYSGGTPLQFALYQKLRGKSGFAQMQSTVEGRSLLLSVAP